VSPVRVLIPDGCNAGTVLRVALGVNLALLAFVLAPVGAPGLPGVAGTGFASRFLEAAAIVEPVTLVSLLGWCLLRRLGAGRQSAWAQRAASWLVPALASMLLQRYLAGESPAPGLVAAVSGLLGGAAAQHYLELRDRAFSPAIEEARFQALQSRIRPHFLFNSLNAVLAVIRDDPRRAESMLESIAELFRALMGDVRRLVPLEQELALCRSYVEIEQVRLGERLQVEWDLGAVHPRASVPQLLLQPLIENAVRYGAERAAGTCDIVVRVRQLGFRLEIFVSNPIAREPVQREGNQIGLANIRGRLALIYDLEASLTTRVHRERFELTLQLPVESRLART
jgi:two-component system sensor histidine kinase AlgZ